MSPRTGRLNLACLSDCKASSASSNRTQDLTALPCLLLHLLFGGLLGALATTSFCGEVTRTALIYLSLMTGKRFSKEGRRSHAKKEEPAVMRFSVQGNLQGHTKYGIDSGRHGWASRLPQVEPISVFDFLRLFWFAFPVHVPPPAGSRRKYCLGNMHDLLAWAGGRKVHQRREDYGVTRTP